MHPKTRLRMSAVPRISGLPPRMTRDTRYAPNRLRKGTPEYRAFHSFSNQIRSAANRGEIALILSEIGKNPYLPAAAKNFLRHTAHQSSSRIEQSAKGKKAK